MKNTIKPYKVLLYQDRLADKMKWFAHVYFKDGRSGHSYDSKSKNKALREAFKDVS